MGNNNFDYKEKSKQIYPIDLCPEWTDETKAPPVSLGFWFGKESEEALPDYKAIDEYLFTLKNMLQAKNLRLSDTDVEILNSKLYLRHSLDCPVCGGEHEVYIEEHLARLRFVNGQCIYPALVCVNGRCTHANIRENIHQYVDKFAVRNNILKICSELESNRVFSSDDEMKAEEAIREQDNAEQRRIYKRMNERMNGN